MTIRPTVVMFFACAMGGASLLGSRMMAPSPVGAALVDPAARCAAAKLSATGKAAQRVLACQGKAARKGVAVVQKCLDSANTKLAKAFDAADIAGGCSSTGNGGVLESRLQTFMDAVVTALRPDGTASTCTALKLKSVGRKVAKALAVTAKDRKKPNAEKLLKAALSLQAAFVKKFNGAEGKEDCQTTSDAEVLDGQANGFIGFAVGALRGLTDVGFDDSVSQFTPVPVTLNGQLVATTGDLTGQVVATYGSSGQAVIVVTADLNLSIAVGGHTVTMTLGALGYAVDGVSVAPADIMETFWTEIESGADASLWSPQGQALLALSAVLESLPLSANIAVLLNGGATAAAQTAFAPAVIVSGNPGVRVCSDYTQRVMLAAKSELNTCLTVTAVSSVYSAGAPALCLFLGRPDPYDVMNRCCAAAGCPCRNGYATDCGGAAFSGGAAAVPDDCTIVTCAGYCANRGECRFGPIPGCNKHRPACCVLTSTNACTSLTGCYGYVGIESPGTAGGCSLYEMNVKDNLEFCHFSTYYAHTLLPGETCGFTCCANASTCGPPCP